MKRRDFLRCIAGGAVAAAAASWHRPLARAAEAISPVSPGGEGGRQVAIRRFLRESEAPPAVDDALELLGGLDKLVRPGEVVMIKPNMVNAFDRIWVGRTTNPRVVEGVIRAVVDCGGSPVVAEGTCEQAFRTTTGFAKHTGLLDVCRRYGAEFVDLNFEPPVAVKVPEPLLWPRIKLARAVTRCDRFISVPVMKTHYSAGYTLGMKNLVGVTSARAYAGRWGSYTRADFHNLTDQLWQRKYGSGARHSHDRARNIPLRAAISDLAGARPIDAVVVDATWGEERQSPQGETFDIKKRCGSYFVLAGFNTVAVDAVGAHIMRIAPDNLQQLRFAAAKGLGPADLEQIEVVGERLEDVVVPFRTGQEV